MSRKITIKLKERLRRIDPRQIMAYVLFSFGLILAALLSIPLLAGALGIIWGNADVPSPSASIQLAIVSTALGAMALWYVAHLNSRLVNESSEEAKSRQRYRAFQRRGALAVGTMLLFSAMCFTLFALLCPLLPEVINAEDFLSTVVKWSSVLSLMAGSLALGFSLCIGIFDIWVWSSPGD